MADTQTDTAPEQGERIAKRMARAGVCSRRDAEKMIAARRVTLDGAVVTEPGTRVPPGAKIAVDGKPIAEADLARLWRYYKPEGLICTNKDPEGRTSIFDRLPSGMPRVVTVGRLDMSSEGLLLLTNDGGLARRLELPSTGWTRRYRVRAYGMLTDDAIAAMGRGVTVDGVKYGPIQVTVDRAQGANTWMTVTLKEGKNREIRRVFENAGLTVNRLIRTAFGPFQLGHMREGEVDEVPGKIIQEQLGGPAPSAESRRAHRRR